LTDSSHDSSSRGSDDSSSRTSYGELTVAAFLDAVAAPRPAPGGGVAAATTTALAAGLVAMAARFSRSHLGDADEADAIAARADSLRVRALALADQDATVYASVLAAYRLPKDTEDRRERIRAALRRACEVPLEIATGAAEVATLAADVGARGNPNLTGDAATAVHLAVAAVRAATGLARINARLGDLGSEPVERAAGLAAAAEAAAGRLVTADRLAAGR
jgi:methenyltetrahydrofolate cyclohydrolase